jgi:hypothetical protein
MGGLRVKTLQGVLQFEYCRLSVNNQADWRGQDNEAIHAKGRRG